MALIRRSFLGGLIAAIAAPAIVRAASLMPIHGTLLVPENALIIPRARVLGPPRCDRCFAAWGMCSHTGGPFGPPADQYLDKRVAEMAYEPPKMYSRQAVVMDHPFNPPGWPKTGQ